MLIRIESDTRPKDRYRLKASILSREYAPPAVKRWFTVLEEQPEKHRHPALRRQSSVALPEIDIASLTHNRVCIQQHPGTSSSPSAPPRLLRVRRLRCWLARPSKSRPSRPTSAAACSLICCEADTWQRPHLACTGKGESSDAFGPSEPRARDQRWEERRVKDAKPASTSQGAWLLTPSGRSG